MSSNSSEALSGWALILGASSGFGAATALTLARRGMDILGVHLDRRSTLPAADEVKRAIEDLGRRVELFNVNAADPAKRAQVIAHLRERVNDGPEKTIRVFMHSLAFGTLGPFLPSDDAIRIDQRQLEMTVDVMAHSFVYWAQELCEASLFGPGSRLFAMTSEGSRRVWPSYGAISSAKAALESHVRQLALELAPMEVSVNAILAGVTDTPAIRKIPGCEDLMREAERRNPHGRLTTPEDVASVIAALSHPSCGWITGTTIRVDGGENLSS